MPIRRDEAGVSLVEMMLAMVLFGLVITGVDASVTMVNTRQIQVSGQTQSIDELQMAEETLSRDLHAAVAQVAPPTATSLDFLSDVGGSVPEIYAQISNHVLTIGTVTSTPAPGTRHPLVTVANLDSTSGFSPVTCSVTTPGVVQPTVYWVSTGVNLSRQTPQVGAPQPVNTAVGESDIVAWNIQYQYQLALTTTGATTTC